MIQSTWSSEEAKKLAHLSENKMTVFILTHSPKWKPHTVTALHWSWSAKVHHATRAKTKTGFFLRFTNMSRRFSFFFFFIGRWAVSTLFSLSLFVALSNFFEFLLSISTWIFFVHELLYIRTRKVNCFIICDHLITHLAHYSSLCCVPISRQRVCK